MPLVYHQRKKYRSNFRKLPFGALFWDSDTLNAAPSLKTGRRGTVTALDTENLKEATAVTTNFSVVLVPKACLQYAGVTA